jgi:hypothetical protein
VNSPQNRVEDLDTNVNSPTNSPNPNENQSTTPLPPIPEQTTVAEPPNIRPRRERKVNQKYNGDQWVNVGICSRTKMGLESVSHTKEASFLAKLDWTNIKTPIEEK